MTYTTLNQYLKERFGQKVYKIALNGGFTCPNRDGTLDTRGCIFCSKGGSGDFAEDKNFTITEQIEQGKKRISKKIKDGKYIAYFQAFTNTYASQEKLRAIYEEAIYHKDIIALSIATRPDCINDDVLELLEELNKIKPVFVELGLQTIHPESAKYIRRGYELEIYDTAVKQLHDININVVTHIILGLPNESREDMIKTVEYVSQYTDGIKLQLLHVLEGTDLAKDYKEGKFEVLTLEEYTSIIVDCLRVIRKDVVIHRLTGDGAKKDLIAPMWSADKKNVLNTINKAIANA